MSELTDIRQGIADALSAGLTGVQVSAYILASPSTPSVSVFPSSVDFHQAMGNGLAFWNFTVRALVSLSTDIGAQQLLDGWMGENGSGVKAAIEADPTLGGVCDHLTVTGVSNYQSYVLAGGQQVIGADWNVQVYL